MQLGSDWRRLHPLSPLLRAGRFVVVAATLLADDVLSRLELAPRLAALVLLAALVVGAAAGWWAWSATAYRVTADEVELRTGMLFRRHRRLPLARLESVDVARPLVARLFGLAQVRLEAVSDSESEVRLSYLGDATALSLRNELRRRLDDTEAPSDGPGGAGPVSSRQVIRVPTGELVLACVASRVATVWPVALAITLALLAFAGPFQAIAFGVVAGIVPVFIGLVEAERLHGFALSDIGGDLHVSRGLLNELHQRVPIGRIQAVAVVEPLLWRPFHRARLVVDIAGYRGAAREERRRTSVLLPIAPPDVVAEVLARVQPGLALGGPPPTGAPPAARWRAPIRWRTYSVVWGPQQAVLRRGLLCRRTDIVPHVKVQSLRISQGPWQRALGLGTLHLDTAGTEIRARAPHRGQDEAERLAWASRRAALSSSESGDGEGERTGPDIGRLSNDQ
ncbi:MAG: PH domain-containing protein [Acidimicrobiales bacterium]